MMMRKSGILFCFGIMLALAVNQPSRAQEKGGNRVYIQLKVNGLSCPFCAYGLEKKLKKLKGQQNLHIAIEEGLVTLDVPADNKPTKEAIEKIVTDAGFTAIAVNFSDTPFKPEDEDS